MISDRLFQRLFFSFVTVFFAMHFNTSAHAADGAPPYKVIAYYLASTVEDRHYTPLDIDAGLLTHLNYAFAGIEHGEVVIGDANIEVKRRDNFTKLRQLKKRYAHLKTMISVGGWEGSRDFSDAALTPASRAKFAVSAVVFIRANGFDGVDIDWEFPVAGGEPGNGRRPADKENFTLLLQALRDKFDAAGKEDGREYLLTAAIGNNAAYFSNTEMDKVAAILDWVNVMTYDFSGHWNQYAGHNAPLYVDPATKRAGTDDSGSASASAVVERALAAGVPAAKLVMGMPFYGYSWKKCGAAQNGQSQDCHGKGRGTWDEGSLDFSDIDPALVNKKGYTRYWNGVAKVPYLFNAGSGEFITYDDLESFDYKIKFLKEKALAGAMFWEVTGDRHRTLQRKLAHDLLGK